MDIDGYPWISMDNYSFSSMDIHGHPYWLFVKVGMPLLIPAFQNSQLAA
jgi:hypothetical protein